MFDTFRKNRIAKKIVKAIEKSNNIERKKTVKVRGSARRLSSTLELSR